MGPGDFIQSDTAPRRTGGAKLRVAQIDGASSVTNAWATDPMKLLTPRARGKSVWVYTSSLGGGMVAGDATHLNVEIDTEACCFLSTQASTKIYRNSAGFPCTHRTEANLGADALLVFAPDPVQMFAQSTYGQRQIFRLDPRANLVLLDWMSSGRAARGERWAFDKYFSRNELIRGGKRVFVDALLLDSADGVLTERFRGGRIDCYATVVMVGPALAEQAGKIFDACNRQPLMPRAPLVFAASPLPEGVLLRIGGTTVAEVAFWIYRQLRFVCDLLHDDPWARKW